MVLIVFSLMMLFFFLVFRKYKVTASLVVDWVISYFFALGLVAYVFCVSLFINVGFFWIELLLILAGGFFVWKMRKDLKLFFHFSVDRLDLLILTGIFIYTLVFIIMTNKWGDWDAWAIWNLHAKFLASGQHFDKLFTNDISWTHPDYPLMLPGFIAAFWNSFGTISPAIPAFVSYFTGIGMILLLTYSLKETVSPLLVLVAILTVSSPLIMFSFSSNQYADGLLGVFILICLILFDKREQCDDSLFLLIGFFAASATWIKNEGIPFFGIYSIALLFYFRSFRKLVFYGGGIALPLIILFVFKLFYAPSNDVVGDGTVDIFSKLTDTSRYVTIFGYLFKYTFSNVQVLYFLIVSLLLINIRAFFDFKILVLVGLLAVYTGIYLITPHGLEWHLASSYDRLLFQLLPGLMYSVIVLIDKKVDIIVSLKHR